jgi:beta-glucosidase
VGAVTTVPEEAGDADLALVFIESPSSGPGYTQADGYVPISLQYGDYTAATAREHSLAGDAPLVLDGDSTDRTFRGKSTITSNRYDAQMVRQARELMGDKPVIVVLDMSNPTVVAELEPMADALLVQFAAQDQAVLDTLFGGSEPSGLLPMQMPKDMATVEAQYEDTPFDMEPYVDAEGHAYDFGFGISWSGVISDDRTARYAPAASASIEGFLAGLRLTAGD